MPVSPDPTATSLIDRNESVLLIVDMQQRLMPAVREPDKVTANAALLIKAALRMRVPALASEHYPQGIGPTVRDLADLLSPNAVIEKIHFSCMAEPGFGERLASMNRRQVVIAGTETHVCVQQSALDLARGGYAVFLVADATSTMREVDWLHAVERMRAAGIVTVTTQMVIFEWLRRADGSLFREMLQLIKQVL